MKDPRVVGLVTVTAVEMSRDLAQANVFVSIYGSDEDRELTMAGLESVATGLRGRVGRALRLRIAPHITFRQDESIARASRIETLLAGLKPRRSAPMRSVPGAHARRNRRRPLKGCCSSTSPPASRRTTSSRSRGARCTKNASATPARSIRSRPDCSILLLGRATRLMRYVHDEPKVYEAVVKFGAETDTEDPHGAVVREAALPSRGDRSRRAARAFVGTIEQVPPAFSAKQVDGERSYDLARAGRAVPLAPVSVTVHECTLSAFEETQAVSPGAHARVVRRRHVCALDRARPGARRRRARRISRRCAA